MSVSGDAVGSPNPDATVEAPFPDDEINTLQEKLALLQQIRELENPSRNQPVMRVKVPEGSYNMSPTEFRTFKKDCITYQELTNYSDTNYPEWDNHYHKCQC